MQHETTIIQAVCDGDSDEYRLLVERYQTGLIIHCENIVKNRAEAEDIAQEAFITAYQTLAQFDPAKARFSTWLYRIATNKAIDLLRRNKRQVSVDDIEALADTTTPADIPADEIAALRQAVETLEPPEYAQVIKAYFWQGKSYKTIADVLDITTNTVGTWIRRAKLQLKEAIA